MNDLGKLAIKKLQDKLKDNHNLSNAEWKFIRQNTGEEIIFLFGFIAGTVLGICATYLITKL